MKKNMGFDLCVLKWPWTGSMCSCSHFKLFSLYLICNSIPGENASIFVKYRLYYYRWWTYWTDCIIGHWFGMKNYEICGNFERSKEIFKILMSKNIEWVHVAFNKYKFGITNLLDPRHGSMGRNLASLSCLSID